MPDRYAIANWKMNLPPCGLDTYFKELTSPQASKVVVAPPFPYLKALKHRTAVAGQNCADQPSGAFTGEVSAAMLRDCGATFVILGHSERRNIYGETDATIARKLSLAIDNGLTPVFCVGESQKVRDAGQAESFVAGQIQVAAVPQLEKAAEVLIAYEPVWAVGTGRNATGDVIAGMVRQIRAALGRFWPAKHVRSSPILYGGSVTPENIGDMCENGDVNGFLVGGASLDPFKFSAICEATARAAGS
jgi:triosephosphate isomerase (TIM)